MFNRLKYKLARFMYGRYGADALYKGLLFLYIALMILNMFLNEWIIALLMTAVFFWMVFRVLSKNRFKRAKENMVYLALTAPVRRFFSVWSKRLFDRKKRYRVCPFCKATLRLPVKKGKHNVKCPKCSKTFKVSIRF